MRINFRIKRLPLSSRYLYISAFLAICFALLPILKTLPSSIKAVIVLCILFFSALDVFRNVCYITILGLAVVLNLLVWFGEYQFVPSFSFADKFAMMCLFWLTVAIGVVLCVKKEWNSIIRLKKIILNLLIISSITTIIGSFMFEDASRALASGDQVGNTTYQLWNIGGYGFIYALALSIPWIIYLYNKSKEKKYVVILLLFCFCIIRASYATAILLTISGLVMSCFLNRLHTKRGSILALLCFALLFLIGSFVILDMNFWEFILRLTSNNRVLNFRVQNMRDLILYQNVTGDISMRGDLYTDSWDAFLENPIWGNAFSLKSLPLGYHSEFIDLLGGCGLIGLLLLIILICFIVKCISKFYNNTTITKYYVWAMIELIIFGFINTILGSIEFAIIIGFVYLPEHQEKKGLK